jgi:nucleoside-diphosphate-sugar epimerase
MLPEISRPSPMEHQPERVLVTGATGAVGPRVVAALCEVGYRVRALAIQALEPKLLPEGVEVVVGDITDRRVVDSAMSDVQAVVHLAALLHILRPEPAVRPEYERVNVGGTEAVVAAAQQRGVERVVYFSTIAVYGCQSGSILTEDTEPQPDTLYAETKLAAERIVASALRTDGQPLGTVLRMGAIYGARIKGNYRRLLVSLARGRFIPVGNGRNRRTLIYDRDAARAVVLALQHPATPGQVFNVTDGQFHTLNEILTAMCQALQRRPPRWSIPVTPVRVVAEMMDDTFRLLGQKAPVARATVNRYIEDVAVDGQRFQCACGFRPAYDLESGWREVVADMKRAGAL